MPESNPRTGRCLPRVCSIVALAAVVWAAWGCGKPSTSGNDRSLKTLEDTRAQCEEWGKGWLAPELKAQRWDKVVMEWWDQTRHSGDAWAVLDRLNVGTLELPRFGDAGSDLGDGVLRRSLLSGGASLSTTDARREWSAVLKEAGWICAQSEWRTVAYREVNGKPVTEVDMNLHLIRTRDLLRAEVQGTWEIEWLNESPGGSPEGRSLPDAAGNARRVAWLRGQWLQKNGTPRFIERATIPVEPGSLGGGAPDPLIVADWNQDGNEDLLMPGANLWLNRDSGGQWIRNRIIPVDSLNFQIGSVADFDRDGHLDLLAMGGQQMFLFRGKGRGEVELPPIITPAAVVKTPSSVALLDFDRDGDLDVWVGQWTLPYDSGVPPTPVGGATNGPSATFWRNLGNGRFEEMLNETGLGIARDRFVLSGVFFDFDGDHHPEFVQVNDYAGVDFFAGQTDGGFSLKTQELLGETRSFGMGHVIGDFDRNGFPDLLVIGMNAAVATRMDAAGISHPDYPAIAESRREMHRGNRVWLNQGAGRWTVAPWQRQVAETGWAWGGVWLDSNNDGLGEFYFVNGHSSNEKAYDQWTDYWCCIVYQDQMLNDPVRQEVLRDRGARVGSSPYSEGGHYRNQWRVPAGHDWVEMGWIGGVALPEDSRNVVAWDYDGDGRQDLLVLTREYFPKERSVLRVLHNEGTSGSWLAVRVPPRGGVSPWGAEVELTLADGTVRREWLVDQQGHRSQPAPIAHFGLGRQVPRKVRVRWPDGESREEAVSAGDRYLTVERH